MSCRSLRELRLCCGFFPGAYAPGFMLSLAPRASSVLWALSWGLRPRLYAGARSASLLTKRAPRLHEARAP